MSKQVKGSWEITFEQVYCPEKQDYVGWVYDILAGVWLCEYCDNSNDHEPKKFARRNGVDVMIGEGENTNE